MRSRDFFDRYRNLSADSKKPGKYEDCAIMYRECAAASGYNKDKTEEHVEDVDEEDEEETSTDAADDANDDDGDVTTEMAENNDINAADARALSGSSRLTQIILNRSE